MISLLVGLGAFLLVAIGSVVIDPQPSHEHDRDHALPVDVTT
jgi:hypothetical protein